MVNVHYKHPNLGLVKTVPEKELLLSFLSFLQSLEDPVVLFFYYMDATLPTILAKLNKYKMFGESNAELQGDQLVMAVLSGTCILLFSVRM